MSFRKAIFIFAAGAGHAALTPMAHGQAVATGSVPAERRAPLDANAADRPDRSLSAEQRLDGAGRIVEPGDGSDAEPERRPPPAGRPDPRFNTPPQSFNADGPYFLGNVAGNRRQPGYEPFQRRIGSFIIAPGVTTRVRTDDNWTDRGQSLPLATVISATATGVASQFGTGIPPALLAAAVPAAINPALVRVGDVAFDLAPRLALSSDWSRHALSINGSARFTRFARLRRLDRDEFSTDGTARLDMAGDGALSVRLGYVRQAEPPGTNGLAVLEYFGFGPSLVTRASVDADATARIGRFRLLFGAGLTREHYLPLQLEVADLIAPAFLPVPGVPAQIRLSQAFRDRAQIDVRLRVTYPLGPDFDIFFAPSYSNIRQVHKLASAGSASPVPFGAAFDSDTYGALAGVRKDFGHLVVVQLGVGLRDRVYVSPLFVRARRFDLEGAVDWYPTPLLSLRANASQQFRGNGIPGQADIVTRTVGLRADYEVLRNVGLRAEGNASWDRFPAAPGTLLTGGLSARQDASVEVLWRIGRSTEASFSAGAHRRRANASIFLGNFAASRFRLSLTRRL